MKKYKIDNYLVEANSPIKAMKAVQTLKDAGYCWNDIHKMCIKNNWYTYGSSDQYNNMFKKATCGEWKAEQIAQDIQTHSAPDVKYEDVLREIKKLHVYDSKVKDSMYKVDYGQGIEKIYQASNANDALGKFLNDYPQFKSRIVMPKITKVSDAVKDEAFDRQTIEALIADEQAAIDAYNVAIANLKGKISNLAIEVLKNIRDDEQNHVANLNAILSNNITEKNLEDSLGYDLNKYQEWVDYDIKHYGHISDKTNDELKKAGLKVVKDKYNNYEVIA